MVWRNKRQKAAQAYHQVFAYPLTSEELMRWEVSPKALKEISVSCVNSPKTKDFAERRKREEISDRKLTIAKKAAQLLAKIPMVKMVAVTGALAMRNANKESDIDLMIVTKANTLWTSRLLTYLILKGAFFKLRKPNDQNQKDKLCLNLWLDETALTWESKDRNIYTAHEIVQTVPLVNKDFTYEKFLSENQWVLGYWPKAVQIKSLKLGRGNNKPGRNLFEKFAFRAQYLYMQSKITQETITTHKAFFHPNNWGKLVLGKLN